MELFTAQGFQPTTVRQVAERASVSEQTVYNVFGDKVGLLYAAGMHAINSGVGDPEAGLLETLQGEENPIERIRIVARYSRRTWEGGSLELELMVFSPYVKDPRLVDLAEQALAHNLASTKAICEVLFPDPIRRPGLSIEDIATFATALDSAFTITTLTKLGWTMEQWEEWAIQLLTLFLDPDWVAENDTAPPGS